MNEIIIILFIILALSPAFIFLRHKIFRSQRRKKAIKQPFPKEWDKILRQKVEIYRKLKPEEKKRFQERVKLFLSDTRITGVDLEVTDDLKLLVAASAIIPVFNFKNWDYVNLGEVLLYHGLIRNYEIEEDRKRRILGQVRPFQTRHLLMLSKESLEKGFESMSGKQNVGFHEFAHLIDQADGDIDGVPKTVFSEELVKPWTSLMYREIERMKKGRSDINPYGVTSEAEFFAVVSEYFFENPDKFQKKHPKLYKILSKAFRFR